MLVRRALEAILLKGLGRQATVVSTAIREARLEALSQGLVLAVA